MVKIFRYRGLRQDLVLVVALLHVVVGAVPAAGLVLCVGANGHQAIEFADGDWCADRQAAPTATPIDSATSCDDCTDTPVLQAFTFDRSVTLQLVIPSLAQVLAAPVYLPALQSVSSIASSPTPPAATDLVSRQFVLLLL